MKHKAFIFLAIIAVLTMQGCKPKAKATSWYKSGSIPIDTAAKLTSNYLRHPQLSKIFQGLALGGTFPKKFFNLSTDSNGVIFWFCYKGGSHPEFFLALEHLEVYNLAKLPKKPTRSLLIKSKGLFRYSTALTARSDVKSYFIAHANADNVYESIPNAMVQRYMASFDSLMNEKTNLDSNGERYCKYAYCYFDKSNDFDPILGFVPVTDYDDFLTQTPDDGFVRYYFGFAENDKPNRIRVELFSVDAAGKNITSKPGSKLPDAMVLQRSFPPPPYE